MIKFMATKAPTSDGNIPDLEDHPVYQWIMDEVVSDPEIILQGSWSLKSLETFRIH